GTMAYTFTYTDCANHTHNWTYTYTIAAPDFTLPANGASTVNCPADAVAPTPPTVTDACGRAITPTVTTPSPVTCNGTMVYTFTYTDCANHTHAWTYTYTIAAPDFTLPANGSSTVNCPSDAVAPTPPPVTCNVTMVYTFTYTDCTNHTHAWTYTYTIAAPDFTLPANAPPAAIPTSDAVAPTPPTVTDACGRAITPTVTTPSPVTCNEMGRESFTYTDCANHTHAWTYTYTIAVPDFTLPASGSSTVTCPSYAVATTP